MRDREDRYEGRYDDVEENDSVKLRDSSKHRSKERSTRDDKDPRSGERGSKDRKKDDRDDRDKEKDRSSKDKRRDKDRKDITKERDYDKDTLREREKENSRTREKEREKGKDKHKDRDRERGNEKSRHRDSVERNREKDADKEDGRSREKDRASRKHHRDEGYDKSKEEKEDNMLIDAEDGEIVDTRIPVKGSSRDEGVNRSAENQLSASEIEGRISKMKEQRQQKQPEGDSDILSWVSKSRKLEEKRNSEKQKALRLSKVFEEQDDIYQDEFEVDTAAKHSSRDLAGVKVLHGLDKVIEGGAVVLTLKDQSILADGDLNEEADVLENVEIGEQKRRDEAYQAGKKKSGTYEDKFNEEPGFQKKMLPQYDDPAADEGITLDARGRFTGEAEKKLEELRKRIQGVPTDIRFEDLRSSENIVSDYYTSEEMLKFKKPMKKKKKSLRKKDKLDLDALEAEAVSAGLGVSDLGSRNSSNREALREAQERMEAEMRSNAYHTAYAKADEASKALREEQSQIGKTEEDDGSVFGEDDEELRKSLERARKVALKKQEESKTSGPEAIARLTSLTASNPTADDQTLTSGEENKVVFTEMEEFVGGLQLDEEAQRPESEDMYMEEDIAPDSSDQEMKDEDGGWTEVKDTDLEETPANVVEVENMIPDETIHEAPVGKGLSGALKMLKDRGTLKETIEWGGRNMDKKKSKLLGIHEHEGDGQKEIRLERTDEYGRVLTPKEAFRLLSHKFHGKGPGKGKQEKRIRQYEEEQKIKRMKNSDTPSHSVERMREAQAQLKTPYLVLSGHVKPGQTSDPTSGFATVEKDFAGGLTPMLGDRKVEHFLGIKRKSEPGNMGPPPPRKPKP